MLHRKLVYMLLTLIENIITMYVFDHDKYSEQMVFGVLVIVPIILSISGALSRLSSTTWDDFIVSIAVECSQTYLFVLFCDFHPQKTLVLMVPLAVQLALLVVDHKFERCCSNSINCASLSSCSVAGTAQSVLADADWRAEMSMLLFGAVTSMLPMLCKTGDTESGLANAFIRVVASPFFALVLTSFLWSLEVLAADATVPKEEVTSAWYFLVAVNVYFSFAYTLVVGLGAFMSVAFLLFPMALAFLAGATAILLPAIPILAFLVVAWVGAQLLNCLISLAEIFCGAECVRICGWSSQVSDAGRDLYALVHDYIKPAFYVLIFVILAIWGWPIARFMSGCGGMLVGWSALNIAFVAHQWSTSLAPKREWRPLVESADQAGLKADPEAPLTA